MNNLVVIQNNQVVVSSKDIAEHFGKHHKDVLENIRHILVAENSATKFFQQSSTVYRGQEFPMYLMNRDGFSLLAMGFTGKKALQWKLKYIEAFNEMENALQNSSKALEFPKRTYKGILVMLMSDLMEMLGRTSRTIKDMMSRHHISSYVLSPNELQEFRRENHETFHRKVCNTLTIFKKEEVISVLKVYGRYHGNVKKVVDDYFTILLPSVSKQVEEPKCISLKSKKPAIDELRKQAKTIDGMLKMLPECKRTKDKHDASIEFVIEGVMSLLLDLQDLRRNVVK